MRKNDLRNGDIIVNRGGYLGVVLKEEEKILYQYIGYDELFEFNDDLTFDDEDYRDGDIMAVYRNNSFLEVDSEDDAPLYERDPEWRRPSKEEMAAKDKELEEKRRREEEEWKKAAEEARKDRISIIAQQFYGNRTVTEIRREEADFFLRGILSPKESLWNTESVERKIVPVPDTENLVIVYDQTQEDEYVKVEFPQRYAADGEEYRERFGEEMKMIVSCAIPEIGFEIHTRCFACRMDETGTLQGLGDDDIGKIVPYFPGR